MTTQPHTHMWDAPDITPEDLKDDIIRETEADFLSSIVIAVVEPCRALILRGKTRKQRWCRYELPKFSHRIL